MSPVVTVLFFRLFCPEDRHPLGGNCEIEMYVGGLELQICVNKYSICGECQATYSFLHFIFYFLIDDVYHSFRSFLPQTSLHLYYECCSFLVVAIPEWVSEAAGVRWFCTLQYNTIYDLVSTCNTRILTEISFNYGNILPDIRHSMAPVKIVLFVWDGVKSGLKLKE